MRIDNTVATHLCSIGLVLLLFMFLLTFSMLTDSAGCYNVRDEKLIVRKLTSTVNSSGIATFSVRGEGLRFFDSLKCIEYDFSGISNGYNGFTTSKIAQIVHFLSVQRRSTFLTILSYIQIRFPRISNDNNGLTTSEIALTFTFPDHGESTGAAGDRGKPE